MPKRKRNPQFTSDEAQTATLLGTEGTTTCTTIEQRRYPSLRIRVCDKELLEPASRVFKTTIYPIHVKRQMCKPHLFPPEGKGMWQVSKTGKPAEQLVEHLKPLHTKEFIRKWEKNRTTCQ